MNGRDYGRGKVQKVIYGRRRYSGGSGANRSYYNNNNNGGFRVDHSSVDRNTEFGMGNLGSAIELDRRSLWLNSCSEIKCNDGFELKNDDNNFMVVNNNNNINNRLR